MMVHKKVDYLQLLKKVLLPKLTDNLKNLAHAAQYYTYLAYFSLKKTNEQSLKMNIIGLD